MSEHKPVIGITLGDFNGVGPEVTLKALAGGQISRVCTPVLYGSVKVLSRYRKLLNLEEIQLHSIRTMDQLIHKRVNVFNCWEEHLEIEPGKATPEAGNAAYLALKTAVADLKNNMLDAIVTAPINKHTIQNDAFKFPGHTEYFAHEFGSTDSLMFLVSPELRVAVATGHIPLEKVKPAITKDLITKKIKLLEHSLRQDFGIAKPKIAVLGLNPHAGEDGLLGMEEKEIIAPVISELKHKGTLVYGPLPADGFFGTGNYRKYDGILAMYHDQGLIPFKTIAFENGVNFTAGLSMVRTSPDHGTAYNIAGKNIADETSMREAIYLACDIVKNRREHTLTPIQPAPQSQP
ncbi:4-hydroxythreonine-4-phosphate dehydrogenase PdxA [Xanthocytophaga agilis]|uniref:4-hydroxythreonine-4-phosphate dehydrogenase PdxA n=1 Tax=Xanthocytophaga agilis TaxID=3048010 RepID=A0AAE3R0P9_9BACT|nr:4-hydroxythreonine-4-phosphate dehydrogenase PdxA [Xanthocytophaga agilis]MDJ1500990.1 4-hydroxythreonine-4-phosphate dehydrogenase PdxA [Xanthocytophaga agilis]